MRAARQTDHKIEALPSQRATIKLDRTFSLQEMKLIRRGLLPQQMENKWFIYWKDDALYFHRSWTGHCIYVIRFTKEGDGGRMFEADVNRASWQYNQPSDELDVKMISYLVDEFLLNNKPIYPGDEPSF